MAFEYYLKEKSAESVYQKLVKFVQDVIMPRRMIDKKLGYIYIYSDCGTEFDNTEIDKLCKYNGIIQNFSCPYTPETHGKIERLWRTINEMSKTMLYESNLAEEWWEHASSTAMHIYNRIITSTGAASPYEKYYGEQPNLNYIRVFGSLGYCHIPLQLRNKSHAPIRSEGVLVGYSEDHSRCYILYVPSLNVFLTTDKVEFFEHGEINEIRKSELLNKVNENTPAAAKSGNLEDYKYLINTLHHDWDDQQLFKTTKVVVDKNNIIVAFRKACQANGKTIGATDGPIFVGDIVKYTAVYNNKLREVSERLIPSYVDTEPYVGMHKCQSSLNYIDDDVVLRICVI